MIQIIEKCAQMQCNIFQKLNVIAHSISRSITVPGEKYIVLAIRTGILL